VGSFYLFQVIGGLVALGSRPNASLPVASVAILNVFGISILGTNLLCHRYLLEKAKANVRPPSSLSTLLLAPDHTGICRNCVFELSPTLQMSPVTLPCFIINMQVRGRTVDRSFGETRKGVLMGDSCLVPCSNWSGSDVHLRARSSSANRHCDCRRFHHGRPLRPTKASLGVGRRPPPPPPPPLALVPLALELTEN
jgi:hypothetical protein